MKRASMPVAVVTGILLACWLMFFNHIEQYQAGIAWKFTTGEMWLQEPGYHITAPWTLVAVVDVRPQRVCITSASHAAFNCKLVQFQSSAWREFIAVEGWRYYWLSNRVSWNASYREEYRGFRDILRGYAFSAQQYPFIKVLEEFDR